MNDEKLWMKHVINTESGYHSDQENGDAVSHRLTETGTDTLSKYTYNNDDIYQQAAQVYTITPAVPIFRKGLFVGKKTYTHIFTYTLPLGLNGACL